MPFNDSYLSYIVLALTTALSNLFNIILIFDDFPGLKNEILQFHDLPGFPCPVRTLNRWIDRLVITKGYEVRATAIEGQNAVTPIQRCALRKLPRKFHVTDGQTRVIRLRVIEGLNARD